MFPSFHFSFLHFPYPFSQWYSTPSSLFFLLFALQLIFLSLPFSLPPLSLPSLSLPLLQPHEGSLHLHTYLEQPSPDQAISPPPPCRLSPVPAPVTVCSSPGWVASCGATPDPRPPHANRGALRTHARAWSGRAAEGRAGVTDRKREPACGVVCAHLRPPSLPRIIVDSQNPLA